MLHSALSFLLPCRRDPDAAYAPVAYTIFRSRAQNRLRARRQSHSSLCQYRIDPTWFGIVSSRSSKIQFAASPSIEYVSPAVITRISCATFLQSMWHQFNSGDDLIFQLES